MLTSFHASLNLQECRQIFCRLALCAVVGAGLGSLFAVSAGESYFLMMRMAAFRPVSIVGSAVSVFFPFVVSFFLIIHSKLWLVYFLCGIRIFLFSSAAVAINMVYGSAGWLVRILLQFPDLCLLPLLIWSSFERLSCKSRKHAFVSCTLFAAAVGMINYCMISPFLANLIDF